MEEILAGLTADAQGDTDDPFQVYWVCYEVLQANQDSRARTVLGDAYHLLQQQAAKITDPTRLHSFLDQVATHRQLVSAWGAVGAA